MTSQEVAVEVVEIGFQRFSTSSEIRTYLELMIWKTIIFRLFNLPKTFCINLHDLAYKDWEYTCSVSPYNHCQNVGGLVQCFSWSEHLRGLLSLAVELLQTGEKKVISSSANMYACGDYFILLFYWLTLALCDFIHSDFTHCRWYTADTGGPTG